MEGLLSETVNHIFAERGIFMGPDPREPALTRRSRLVFATGARQRVPRSAKVVLQLSLGCLARYYGLHGEAHGKTKTAVRTWLACDAKFVVGVVGAG